MLNSEDRENLWETEVWARFLKCLSPCQMLWTRHPPNWPPWKAKSTKCATEISFFHDQIRATPKSTDWHLANFLSHFQRNSMYTDSSRVIAAIPVGVQTQESSCHNLPHSAETCVFQATELPTPNAWGQWWVRQLPGSFQGLPTNGPGVHGRASYLASLSPMYAKIPHIGTLQATA